MHKKPVIKTAFSFLEISMVILIIGFITIAIATSKNILESARLTRAKTLTHSSVVNGIKDLLIWFETTSPGSFSSEDPDNGTAISTWYDINPQLTLKNSATQATSANQPTYVKNAINKLPALQFSTNDYMMASKSITGISALTAFIVAKRIGATTNTSAYTFYNPSVSVNDFNTTSTTVFAYEGGSGEMLQTFRSSPLSTATHPGNRIPYIFATVYNGTTNTGYLNGVEQTTVASSGTFNISNLQIGARFEYGAVVNFYNGYIGEIIVFGRALSSFERKQVESYLSTKWGITITP